MARTESYKKRRKERNWEKAINLASQSYGPQIWLSQEIDRQRKAKVYWRGKRVGAKRRRLIIERDGGCVACCYSLNPRWLTAHHLTPRRIGGTNDIRNLITLCDSCHSAWNKAEIIGGWRWFEIYDWLELVSPYYRAEQEQHELCA